jgi:shikimate kinase
MTPYVEAQARSLTVVINALAARVGAQEAIHLLLAGAVSLADNNMSRAHTIAWLREMANTLEQEPVERAN